MVNGREESMMDDSDDRSESGYINLQPLASGSRAANSVDSLADALALRLTRINSRTAFAVASG